jgi:hypothetical protein
VPAVLDLTFRFFCINAETLVDIVVVITIQCFGVAVCIPIIHISCQIILTSEIEVLRFDVGCMSVQPCPLRTIQEVNLGRLRLCSFFKSPRVLPAAITLGNSFPPTPLLVSQGLFSKALVELATESLNLALTCHEDQNTTWWKTRMDFYSLLIGFGHVVAGCSAIEVYCHWMLTCRDMDDRRGSCKQIRVLGEI